LLLQDVPYIMYSIVVTIYGVRYSTNSGRRDPVDSGR